MSIPHRSINRLNKDVLTQSHSWLEGPFPQLRLALVEAYSITSLQRFHFLKLSKTNNVLLFFSEIQKWDTLAVPESSILIINFWYQSPVFVHRFKQHSRIHSTAYSISTAASFKKVLYVWHTSQADSNLMLLWHENFKKVKYVLTSEALPHTSILGWYFKFPLRYLSDLMKENGDVLSNAFEIIQFLDYAEYIRLQTF